MSQYVEANCKTFPNNAAIAIHTRVKLSGGYLAAAGISDREIGTMERASLAADQYGTVRLRTAVGTCKMINGLDGAIALGADVYTAASGKISTTASGSCYHVGIALEAATAQNDVIEILRDAHGDTSIA